MIDRAAVGSYLSMPHGTIISGGVRAKSAESADSPFSGLIVCFHTPYDYAKATRPACSPQLARVRKDTHPGIPNPLPGHQKLLTAPRQRLVICMAYLSSDDTPNRLPESEWLRSAPWGSIGGKLWDDFEQACYFHTLSLVRSCFGTAHPPAANARIAPQFEPQQWHQPTREPMFYCRCNFV